MKEKMWMQTCVCGHSLVVHPTRDDGDRCRGVTVCGVPNSSEGWDEPCECEGFVERADMPARGADTPATQEADK